jgi:hypothetical protein
MKRCQKCGYECSDAMRFCLECGAPLPDAPIIVSWQDSGTQKQSTADTASFGQSMQTRVAGARSQQSNFSSVPPSKPGSGKKMFIIAGGIAALFLLVFAAGAAIIGYNLMFPKKPGGNVDWPTPTPMRSVEKSPTRTPSATPTPTPRVSPTYTPTPNSNSSTVQADFNRIWVDYNVTENGKKGMRIHTNFTVRGMKDVASYQAIYFEKKDGQRLRDKNKNFYSTAGEVAVYKELLINYDPGVYEDLTVFMPYDELDLDEGKYNLRMSVDLIYKSGGIIQNLTTYDFVYTEPGR